MIVVSGNSTTISTQDVVITVVSSTNIAPVAVTDIVTTTEDTAITIAVLDNDSDANGDLLSISSVSTSTFGTATISGTAIVYTPNANVNGADQFSYNVTDGQATHGAAIVVNISPVNDRPTIAPLPDVTVTVGETITPINVTVGDVDHNTSELTVTVRVRNSALVPSSNLSLSGTADTRTLTLTPTLGLIGSSVISVTVSDGALRSVETFSLIIAPAVITAGIALAPTALTLTEGETVTYSVVLISEPTANVTVSPTVSQTEFSLSPSPLVFGPTNWDTPQQVTLVATDDLSIEPRATYTIAHAVSSTDSLYAALTGGDVLVAFTDNDLYRCLQVFVNVPSNIQPGETLTFDIWVINACDFRITDGTVTIRLVVVSGILLFNEADADDNWQPIGTRQGRQGTTLEYQLSLNAVEAKGQLTTTFPITVGADVERDAAISGELVVTGVNGTTDAVETVAETTVKASVAVGDVKIYLPTMWRD